MSFDNTNVIYLEAGDFNNDNFLVNNGIVIKDAFFILVHASFCGHCTSVKPEFISASKQISHVKFASVHADSNNDSEKMLAKKISTISGIPINGIPCFLYYKNGKFEKYEGGRTAGAFVNFLKSKTQN